MPADEPAAAYDHDMGQCVLRFALCTFLRKGCAVSPTAKVEVQLFQRSHLTTLCFSMKQFLCRHRCRRRHVCHHYWRQNLNISGEFDGGDDRTRTGVHGFAGRCVTTPPRRLKLKRLTGSRKRLPDTRCSSLYRTCKGMSKRFGISPGCN